MTISDAQMKLARLTPVIEVECKKCDSLLGYESDRGEAWTTFLAHAENMHPELGAGRNDG